MQYSYDAAGRLEREDNGNGTFTAYQYDAAGQLEHLDQLPLPAGAVNSRFDYTYDALGRRTRMTTLDGVWAYTYDGTGQLTQRCSPRTTRRVHPRPGPGLRLRRGRQPRADDHQRRDHGLHHQQPEPVHPGRHGTLHLRPRRQPDLPQRRRRHDDVHLRRREPPDRRRHSRARPGPTSTTPSATAARPSTTASGRSTWST